MLAVTKKSAAETITRVGDQVRKAGGLLVAVAAVAVAGLLLACVAVGMCLASRGALRKLAAA